MAKAKSLKSLIRLHKHELDEKQRILADLYRVLAELTRQKRAQEEGLEKEKKALKESGDIHYTFASYSEAVKKKCAQLEAEMQRTEGKIAAAKDSLMETFGELKKFEMTEAERKKLEEDERRLIEAKNFDDIGLTMFRRQEE